MNRFSTSETSPAFLLYTVILLVFQAAIVWSDAPINARAVIVILVLWGIYLQVRGQRSASSLFFYSLVVFLYGVLSLVYLLISTKILGAVVGLAIVALHTNTVLKRVKKV